MGAVGKADVTAFADGMSDLISELPDFFANILEKGFGVHAEEWYGLVSAENISGMTEKESACAAVEAVKQLSKDLGIPQTLREIGIPEEALEQLANDAYNDVCTGGNPREITEADILELYKKAY